MIIGKIRNGKYLQPGDPGFDDPPEGQPIRGIPAIREDKPHTSIAGACHPDQVDRMNKAAVPGVYYEKGTGNMKSTSKHARQREAKRRGLYFN